MVYVVETVVGFLSWSWLREFWWTAGWFPATILKSVKAVEVLPACVLSSLCVFDMLLWFDTFF